jgi:Flp pilus assembly protein TadD/peroxiredoxin
MPDPTSQPSNISRRTFLKGVRYAPMLFLPAPFEAFKPHPNLLPMAFPRALHGADLRVEPHYPATSPLDEMIRLLAPGSDQFATEKYAAEIAELLGGWGHDLTSRRDALARARILADASLLASSLHPSAERTVRNRYGVTVIRRQFETDLRMGRDSFLDQLGGYLGSFASTRTCEFQVTSIREISTPPAHISADICFSLVGVNRSGGQEQRIGLWRTEWLQRDRQWQIVKFQVVDETISKASAPLFADISSHAFAAMTSYKQQLLHGADYWRTVLDGASGVDVYGFQGVAVGDYDGDGYDDIYVCQPAGLPNRLYRNRGDGTFDDVTERTGVDVLDATSCALFGDFENRGAQDLLLVTTSGPLLFVNEGGKFSPKRDAFKFAQLPQGTFMHASLADYDHDGRLDVYFCVYSYYIGLDQYRYPSPYFDARNGPPNFLFHNEGGWSFEDRTEAAGLNADNDRYSFACAWGDHNGDLWPDLYVANDFGRSNLYRNNGDGTFTSISAAAQVEDVGAGMSACWLDFEGDGKQDIYVANMWSAAGLRVSSQPQFHPKDLEDVRALYRRHARGNSLYQNLGNSRFRNVAAQSGAEFGRWAWSSDSFDFDHDGYPDLFIANGYVSGVEGPELSSFFWRQVVANSPPDFSPAGKYEQAWNAINELIRSDHSWSGYERNVLYGNNQDGTFSDVSGISGLDLPDDARAFSLADFDHDGRLEIVLKNRNAPQLRMLRNDMPEIGHSVAFRLRGRKSNRDAVGAEVTVEAQGRRQTKYLQSGSGFLSQHTKELFFGVGETRDFVRVTVRWPSGLEQIFEPVPVNRRVEFIEGMADFRSENFSTAAAVRPLQQLQPQTPEALPAAVQTWLLEPLPAPGFSLRDTSGKSWDLRATPGSKLLAFWASASELSRRQLRSLATRKLPADLLVLAINVDDSEDGAGILSFAEQEKLPFPVLFATREVTNLYNIVYRYLFDRRRDMGLPTSFLLNQEGLIVKIYQGEVSPDAIVTDLAAAPRDSAGRMKKALPFLGTLYLHPFERNDFTYGVAFFQRGYLDAATDAFSQVIAARPDDAEAHYNLGTLYLRRNDLVAARTHLQNALALKPNHAEAWNNLGMVAAQQGNPDEAVKDFKQSLALRPNYAVALSNLGNVYRRQGRYGEAEQLLSHALRVDPDTPEVNYSLAMVFAQQEENARAEQSFQRALALRPGYPDALNNLGVLLVREQRYSDAEEKFRACIQNNPDFDQAYLNLARLYVLLNDKAKARDTLEALLRREPEHVMAQQALKMLQ